MLYAALPGFRPEIFYKSYLQFLGMNITEYLNWYTRINVLCSSLSKAYLVIKTLKDIMSLHVTKCIYFAYFQSRLKYGVIQKYDVNNCGG